jgi:hypothetical protein
MASACTQPDDARVHSKLGLLAATTGLLATLSTAAACVGPFVAILFGVGGFGWLTRYAHLRVPATVLTALVLGIGFWGLYGPRACPRSPGRRAARALLWLASALAIAINVFEYAVMPRLF